MLNDLITLVSLSFDLMLFNSIMIIFSIILLWWGMNRAQFAGQLKWWVTHRLLRRFLQLECPQTPASLLLFLLTQLIIMINDRISGVLNGKAAIVPLELHLADLVGGSRCLKLAASLKLIMSTVRYNGLLEWIGYILWMLINDLCFLLAILRCLTFLI